VAKTVTIALVVAIPALIFGQELEPF